MESGIFPNFIISLNDFSAKALVIGVDSGEVKPSQAWTKLTNELAAKTLKGIPFKKRGQRRISSAYKASEFKIRCTRSFSNKTAAKEVISLPVPGVVDIRLNNGLL